MELSTRGRDGATVDTLAGEITVSPAALNAMGTTSDAAPVVVETGAGHHAASLDELSRSEAGHEGLQDINARLHAK